MKGLKRNGGVRVHREQELEEQDPDHRVERHPELHPTNLKPQQGDRRMRLVSIRRVEDPHGSGGKREPIGFWCGWPRVPCKRRRLWNVEPWERSSRPYHTDNTCPTSK